MGVAEPRVSMLAPRTQQPRGGPGAWRERARVPSVPRELTTWQLSGECLLHKPDRVPVKGSEAQAL